MAKKVIIPVTDPAVILDLKAGDEVALTGQMFTGRDAAHKRLFDLIQEGKELPIDLQGSCIYYVGPSPARPGKPIGSAGPTTSYRMDAYSPTMMEFGNRIMIGKGKRSQEVKDAMVEYGAVYLGAIGGAAALIASAIKSATVVAYEDLGPEAIRLLEVEDFPATVVNDAHGGDAYIEGVKKYKK